jgi:hypothetical protein
MDNKKKKSMEADRHSDIDKILARFDSVEKLCKIDAIEVKVNSLEILLIDLKNENKQLKGGAGP